MKEAFEKIKERLEESSIVTFYFDGKPPKQCVPIEDALSIVSEVEAEYINKSTEHINKSGDCSTNWIPCSERLPEEFVDVLVWFEYFRYGEYNRLFQTHGISYTYEGKWSGFVNGTSGWQQLRVIAWMPLPEPWKGE